MHLGQNTAVYSRMYTKCAQTIANNLEPVLYNIFKEANIHFSTFAMFYTSVTSK